MSESAERDSRWYPETPIVAVGTVVFKEGEILTIKRSKELVELDITPMLRDMLKRQKIA
jgi:hypothetical protein